MPTGLSFTVHDLKQQPRGATAVINLTGNAANVRLMDYSQLRAFKAGRNPRVIGGLTKKSPVRLQIPRGGHWYVTVDVIGLRGQVKSSVQVEPPPLKPLRSSSSSPLHQIRHELPPELAAYVDSSDVWDVFISHASEDKEAVAEPLAEELTARGVKVWLDKTSCESGTACAARSTPGSPRVALV
jgi:hypothetical protein